MVKAIVGAALAISAALTPAVTLADRGGDRGRDGDEGRSRLENVTVSGTGEGHWLAGKLDIQRFEAINGSVVAVGLLRGTLTDRAGNVARFEDEAVAIPVATGGAQGTQGVRSTRGMGGLRALVIPAQVGRCQILNLNLAPINLDLLGLTVDTTLIQLVINANQGAGNLLGNLLCAVAGLLDNFTPAAAPQLAGTLNQVVAAL
jgi:hypothetical protein